MSLATGRSNRRQCEAILCPDVAKGLTFERRSKGREFAHQRQADPPQIRFSTDHRDPRPGLHRCAVLAFLDHSKHRRWVPGWLSRGAGRHRARWCPRCDFVVHHRTQSPDRCSDVVRFRPRLTSSDLRRPPRCCSCALHRSSTSPHPDDQRKAVVQFSALMNRP